LLGTELTVTRTSPVAAPLGTCTWMLVAFQTLAVAGIPSTEIVLDPCVPPKFVPPMVIVVPAMPEEGERLPITGGAVKSTPLLTRPFTITSRGPDVAVFGTVTLIAVSLQVETSAIPPPPPILTTLVP
jgi:hypothetical protein